ncbi:MULTISPECIES: iron-containing alcohol dehydrogenase [unclassified Streptomyces]|uniref:iron-containing alcohol dehydrogenase n=1 Tax=unclassified Streptomyces TaxID=2593676 RepID=UPI001369CB53|nr:iron-containing alcohol dehydrogenase [Streptomyces sp. SID6139]MYR21181.1 iron-containing alcohol dehydrogenase [Streptomyces sp. SID6137]
MSESLLALQERPALPDTLSAGLQPLPGHPAAYLGEGAAGRLGAVIEALGGRRVLFVHGPTSYRRSGVGELVERWAGRYRVEHFDGVRPNPRIAQVREGVALARRFGPDVVVGVGGGSSLDVAKAVAVLGAQPADPLDCLRDPGLVTRPRSAALVLLPTTAGSGSEMTRFATVYVEGRKHSLDLAQARADLVLVDPRLTSSLPRRDSVASGLDALAQAVESYWSVSADGGSRALALAALERLLPPLAHAARTGSFTDPGVRAGLAHGASLAGAAIDLTRTTAAHALSYELTARLGLAHGTAVALHLDWLMARHAALTEAECRHPEGAPGVRRRVATVQRLAEEATGGSVELLVRRLLTLGGQPAGLRELALPARSWRQPLTAALTSNRAGNNPCVLTEDDVLRFLV